MRRTMFKIQQQKTWLMPLMKKNLQTFSRVLLRMWLKITPLKKQQRVLKMKPKTCPLERSDLDILRIH